MAEKLLAIRALNPNSEGADYTGEAATRDGHVITGKGPACVFAFAIEVVRYLCGDQVADEIATGTLFR